MKSEPTCPICEKGTLRNRIGINPVSYKNKETEIPVYYQECIYCGSELTTDNQTRTNKRLMSEFKESVDKEQP